MRVPPRAKRCQEILEKIKYLLDYYMGHTPLDIKSDFKYIEEYINEISMEHKLTEIKAAARVRNELSGDDHD